LHFTLFSLSGALILLTCSILSIIIFGYAINNERKTWLLFNIAVSIWGLGAFLSGSTLSESESILWWKVGLSGVIFISVFFYHTVWFFCGLKDKSVLYFAYIQGILFLIILHTKYFITGVELKFNSLYFPVIGSLFHLFTIAWIFIVTYGHIQLYISHKKIKGIKKLQIKYFFFLIIAFLGGITNFFPSYHINIYPLGNFLIPPFLLLVTYAIFRYRLLDITIIIARFIIFIVVFLLSIGIHLAIFYWKSEELINLLGINWFIFLLISSSSLIAVSLSFLYMLIQSKAENRLLLHQRELHQRLLQSSKDITLIKDLNTLFDAIVKSFVDSADIDYCALYLLKKDTKIVLANQKPKFVQYDSFLRDDNLLVQKIRYLEDVIIKDELKIKGKFLELIPEFERLNASVIVPVRIRSTFLGFLAIGSKVSGHPYTNEDLGIYITLANQAALAIENAQFLKELEMTQTEMFQAAKMSSIGTLASGMGHQINNRLQVIRLLIETIQAFYSKGISDKVSSFLSLALENIEQSKKIIDTLGEHARLSSEGYEPLSLGEVFEKSLEMVKLKKGESFNKIKLTTNINNEPPMILGNKSQLIEVFFNLLDNADDAIGEAQNKIYKNGEYVPEIKCNFFHDNDTDFINIVVQDNGIGMSDKDQEKLFVPFHTTKATAQKGTGLGLYVIDRIIESHSGDISVESHYGRGTSFTIKLKIVNSNS
jgi:signal transduction histidine kinase